MTKIKRIEMIKTKIGAYNISYDLRLEFDNDRHANIRIKDSFPKSVANALMQAAQLVIADIDKGNL